MPKEVRKDLSYFTLDCNIFSKTAELRPLLRKFKADGLAVYIHILCDVYGTTGYYFKPEDYEGYLLDIAEDCGISEEKVQLIIAFMADRTLLDAFSLNKNTVFTSHGIQKRYAQAMKGRKRSVAEIKGEYWILTDEEERKIDTFYKSHTSVDKSEKMDDKSEKMDDKSEIYRTTEHNRNKQNETELVLEERKKEIYKNNHQSEFSEMTDEELADWIDTASMDFSDEDFCALFEEYQNEVKCRKEESSFKGKVTKNLLRLESYEEVMNRLRVSYQLQMALNSFLRHCCLNKHIVTNEKLEGIVHRLRVLYESDEEMVRSVQKAINGGYYDIR